MDVLVLQKNQLTIKEKIYLNKNKCINSCADVNKGGDCCDWCYKVAQKMTSGQPPRGCFDFNCDDCSGDRTRHSDTIDLREDIENIRLLHKKTFSNKRK